MAIKVSRRSLLASAAPMLLRNRAQQTRRTWPSPLTVLFGLAPGPAACALKASAPGLDFRRYMPETAPRAGIFRMDGYMVWCSSMVRTPDGQCHRMFSRWPASLGFDAWVSHSEIAYAVASSPEGPYHFQSVALPARGHSFWDGHMTHNPCLLAADGQFYLYYTGNHGPAAWKPDRIATETEWWEHRDNQRIGVATAPHPSGPWTRRDHPLIDVGPETGYGIVNLPCVMKRPDGKYLMVYKTLAPGPGRTGGGVFQYPALAETPLGPFRRHARPMIDKSKRFKEKITFNLDDHFEWFQDGKYYAIVKDQNPPFLTRYERCLLLLESPNGLDWDLAAQPLVTDFHLRWDDGSASRFERLEMPKLYLEDGKPKVLFLASLPETKSAVSFNLALPLRS